MMVQRRPGRGQLVELTIFQKMPGVVNFWARRILLAWGVVTCIFFSNAFAAFSGPLVTVAYDGFAYVANSQLPSQSGGTGWSAAWFKEYGSGGNFRANSTGLTYTGLATTGGSIAWGAGGNGINGNARELPLINSGVVYLQFLSQLAATSSGGTPNIRLTAVGTLTGGIGGNGGVYGTKMSILDTGLSPKSDGSSSSSANLSALNLVIVQIDYQNAKTSMWVNPDLSTFDYLDPPATTIVYAGLAPAFDKVALYSRSPAKYDELKVLRAAPGIPGAPTGVAAVAGNQQATVTFVAPASDAGATISGYTVVSNPPGGTDINAGSTGLSHVVTGLTNGTTYTFTVAATNSVGTGSYSTASAGVIPMGSQTIDFGAAPAITVGGNGTVTATGGASGNPVTFSSATLAACTVNSGTGVVTGLASGTNNCTILANQLGNGSYQAAVQASLSLSISAAPQVPFIPTLASPPLLSGVAGNLLSVLNLGEGAGPALTTCLGDTLSSILGSNWPYQGQSADGGARMGQATRLISFHALDASPATTLGLGMGSGIHLRGANPLNVVTGCGTLLTVPAVYNLAEFGSLLNTAGMTAQINAHGVLTAQVGPLIYVARPDYIVNQGSPGAPSLTTGTDGLLRFTDNAGHTQIFYPAFLEPEVLGNQVAQALSGYLVIQADGTALLTLIGGQQYILTPDLTLGTVPPEFSAAGWWQDRPNHYRYRIYSYANASQGFTVTPR
jgi:hypothetical protein